ncbi:RNI-like protein [Poronia punctata]|nr:RNI-like protein [Poronia punctata]
MGPEVASVPLGESSEMASPISPFDNNSPAPPSPVGNTPRDGRRQKILRGLKRMSSTPTLLHLGRSRSASSPYGTHNSLSFSNFASPTAFTPPASATVRSGYFSSGQGSLSATPEHALKPVDRVRVHLTSCNTGDSGTSPVSQGSIKRATFNDFWNSTPQEIRVEIFSYLKPKELVRISRVCRAFYNLSFDGQLWQCINASEFYNQISADSLANLIKRAGPFARDLNIRGCLQIEHFKRARVLAEHCHNLTHANLEGCRNFKRPILHDFLRNNSKLASLNLASMVAVTNSTCKIISQHCPDLERLNVSWCESMDAKGIKMIVLGCTRLKDLRAGDIMGFDRIDVAKAIFETNNLERLVLSGCADLADASLKVMVHGEEPEIDIVTNRPDVPPRGLRHLDLSRCSQLTDNGVRALGGLVPELESLLLNGCTELTNSALEPILASCARLTHLELEEMAELTNSILSKCLVLAPCANKLRHLSVSCCEKIGDAGMLPVMEKCVSLEHVEMDNTRIGNLVLAQAAEMVRSRAPRTTCRESVPRVGLRLVVYDCNQVTWTGVREILSEVRRYKGTPATYPTEIISLKCFYQWQQTVDQHTKRVLEGKFESAVRLENKWADYMQALAEAGTGGAGVRRRRRRAREAGQIHAAEEGAANLTGRPRARTIGSCSVM